MRTLKEILNNYETDLYYEDIPPRDETRVARIQKYLNRVYYFTEKACSRMAYSSQGKFIAVKFFNNLTEKYNVWDSLVVLFKTSVLIQDLWIYREGVALQLNEASAKSILDMIEAALDSCDVSQIDSFLKSPAGLILRKNLESNGIKNSCSSEDSQEDEGLHLIDELERNGKFNITRDLQLCHVFCRGYDLAQKKRELYDAAEWILGNILTNKAQIKKDLIKQYNNLVVEIMDILLPVERLAKRTDDESYKRFCSKYNRVLESAKRRIISPHYPYMFSMHGDYFLDDNTEPPKHFCEILDDLKIARDEAGRYEGFDDYDRGFIIREFKDIVYDEFVDPKLTMHHSSASSILWDWRKIVGDRRGSEYEDLIKLILTGELNNLGVTDSDEISEEEFPNIMENFRRFVGNNLWRLRDKLINACANVSRSSSSSGKFGLKREISETLRVAGEGISDVRIADGPSTITTVAARKKAIERAEYAKAREKEEKEKKAAARQMEAKKNKNVPLDVFEEGFWYGEGDSSVSPGESFRAQAKEKGRIM